jgi:hypothetical protein
MIPRLDARLLLLAVLALPPVCAAGAPPAAPPDDVLALAKNIPIGQTLNPKVPAGTSRIGFGRAIAVSDRYLVVGSPNDRIATLDTTGTGAAWVFERSSATTGAVWRYLTVLTPFSTCGTPPRVLAYPNMDFGAAVAVHGSTIVVGAPADADDVTGVAGTGSVFVFMRNADGAFCRHKIVGSQINPTATSPQNYGQAGTPSGDAFGSAVAAGFVSTSTSITLVPRGSVLVAAGAPSEDQASPTAVSNVGAVSFFSCSLSTASTPNTVNCARSSSTPKVMPTPAEVGTLSGIQFGTAVAIGSSYVLVGAPGARSNSSALPSAPSTTPACPGVTSTATAGGAVFAYSLVQLVFPNTSTSWVCRFKIGNPSPSAGDVLAGDSRDAFGARVAVSGSTALVGAPGDNNTVISAGPTFTTVADAGSVRAYTRTTSSSEGCVGCWKSRAIVRFGTGADDALGSSIGFSGGYLALGAPGRDGGGSSNRGATYLYRDLRGSFVFIDEVFPNAAANASGDGFGTAVAVGVGGFTGGAPFVGGASGSNGTDPGAAYWFPVGTGGAVSQLQPGTVQANSRFAESTAIGGNVMVVGHPNATVNGLANAGEVQLFVRVNNAWQRLATPLRAPTINAASEIQAGGRFGFKVEASGDGSVLVASSPGRTVNGLANAGAAYLFQRQPGTNTWNFVRRFTDPAPAANAGFGKSLALGPVPSVLFIGSPDFAANRGRLHVFRNPSALAPALAKATADFDGGAEVPPPPGSGDVGDKWGSAVATDGETAVVGAPGNNGGDGSASVLDAATGAVDDTVNAPPDMNAGDQQGFGSSVDVDDGMVAVGAPNTDTAADGVDEGVAYAYSVDAGSGDLGEATMIEAAQGAAGDKWGTDVGTADGAVGMGAPGADVATTDGDGDPTGENVDQGAVNLYECAMDVDDATGEPVQSCAQAETVTGKNGNANDGFGTSIDMNSPEDFVVGAPTADTAANSQVGAAYTNDTFQATPDMAVSAAGLPPTGMTGMPYAGSVTCANVGGDTATAASCSVSGLPGGLGVACVPGAAGQTVAPGAVITCNVTGTPAAAGSFNVGVSTTAGFDPNSGNDTEQVVIVISASRPDLAADASGLDGTGTQGSPYSGGFACVNQNAVPANNVTCTATGLPAGLAVTGCTPTQPANLPAGGQIACTVGGTPSVAGTFNVTVGTVVGGNNAANDADPSNNSDTASIVLAANVPDMAVSLAGLPTNAVVGVAYAGTLACTNAGGATASLAACSASTLPTGTSVGACTPAVPASVAPGATITCPVSGTPSAANTFNVQGTTGATGDTNTGNNTATRAVVVQAAAEIGVDSLSLPSDALVGAAYAGSFRCRNAGAAAATNATCGPSGLPPGIAVTGCTIGGSAVQLPATLAAGATVVCSVAGTPTIAGGAQVTVTADADNDVSSANNALGVRVTVRSNTLFADGFE